MTYLILETKNYVYRKATSEMKNIGSTRKNIRKNCTDDSTYESDRKKK